MAEEVEGTAREEDRLPWLETVDEDYDEGPKTGRIIVLVLIGLAVLAAVIFGYVWFQRHGGPQGSGDLIAAQQGDYKVRPDDPGGLNVSGEGDTAVATSGGVTGNSTIDPRRGPEAPVAGHHARPTPVPTGQPRVVTNVPAPTTGSGSAAGASGGGNGGGSLVQLGSYPSEATANAAWSSQSQRFGFVAGLGKSVQRATVNGATVYRLRVNAGSSGAATSLCQRIQQGGGACFVPRD